MINACETVTGAKKKLLFYFAEYFTKVHKKKTIPIIDILAHDLNDLPNHNLRYKSD